MACGRTNPATLAPNVGLRRPGWDTEGLSKAVLEPPATAEDSHLSTSSPRTAATASGGAGRQHSYRHQQSPVASLPRIQPGAAQASRPSARGPGAQGPMLQEEMGEGIMARCPGGGGYLYGLFQALREATSAAQLLALLRAHPASPCNQLAQRHLRQLTQQPQASGLRDRGGGWGWRVTLGRCGGSGVGGLCLFFV